MAQPSGRRIGTRVSRVKSFASDILSVTPERSSLAENRELNAEKIHVPAHYFLPPSVPSPFAGTLDASLDALLRFGRTYQNSMFIMDVLRKDVDKKTNWTELLTAMLALEREDNPLSNGRHLLEELVFLATRTLLPEQIAENRALMFRMYDAKRSQSMRTILRYDMLREWLKRNNNHYLVVDANPAPYIENPYIPPEDYEDRYPGRQPLMPNVWATLIAAPPEGYPTRKIQEAMKHHISGLDRMLMFTDEEVAGWGGRQLLQVTAQVLLQWQWLRGNNELMEGMEVRNWEDFTGPANESEWVRDAT